jgi:hypothetical protein
MPLDGYREQYGGEVADAPLARQAEPPREPERADPDSWWETEDGSCPPPPIDWDNDN